MSDNDAALPYGARHEGPRPRVVLVEPDERMRRAIAAVADEKGLELIGCGTARAGLNAACALEPACIATSLTLPDIDGVWLTETLRGQSSSVQRIPILMLATVDDEATRVSALEGGVDAFLSKAVSPREVVAQIGALVRMGDRFGDLREPSLPLRAPASGDLDRMPVALVLRALEQERRSGELFLRPIGLSTRRLILSMAGGLLAGGVLDGIALPPLEALRTALEWTGRRFEFTPGGNRTPPPGAIGIVPLLLAALGPSEESAREEAPVPPPAAEEVFDAASLGLSEPPRNPSRPPAPPRKLTPPPISQPPLSASQPPNSQPPPGPPLRRSKSMTMMAPGKDLVETVVRRPDPRSDGDEPAPPAQPPPRTGIKW